MLMTLKNWTELLPCNQSVRRSPYLITGTVLWRLASGGLSPTADCPPHPLSPALRVGHLGLIIIN